MTDLALNLFSVSWKIFKYPIFLIVLCFAFFGASVAFEFVVQWCKGSRPKKGVKGVSGRPGLFQVIRKAPGQIVRDWFAHSPEYFGHQGVVIFCGRQGSGKTIALVEQTMRFQEEYPKVKVIGNLGYKYQDAPLDDWRQLMDYNNGIQGVCVQIDEMQNWFSSNQSKNFPPEMLEVVTQNRKNRRIILGTSQVFCRLSKPIREQVTEVRNCFTFFGVITVVHRLSPSVDSEGTVSEYKHLGWYAFVHTPKIRKAYDTYQVIHSLSKSGFVEKLQVTE